MEILLRNLEKLTRLTLRLAPLSSYFTRQEVSKGDILLRPGDVASSVWFIGQGILRAYHPVESRKKSHIFPLDEMEVREVTSWIVPEGGFLTDVKSFLYQVPAMYYLEVVESGVLYSLPRENYLKIQENDPAIARLVFEHTLLMADLRVQMCNLRSAQMRLDMFNRMYPGISARLSVNLQASYLNIDPSTLSRFRAKKN